MKKARDSMVTSLPKVLVLFSAPLVDENNVPIDTLDIAAEREAIVKELSESQRQIILRFEFATVDALSRGLKDGFNIFHFSGHGSKTHLAFEDGQGGCHLIDGKFLERLIGISSPFELAVISACYSEPIALMVNKAGVKHVVAINRHSPIQDKAATRFAGVFYRQLFSNDTVQHAFDTAKLLVEEDPQISKLRPTLELESRLNRKAFVPEEKKFVLIPRNRPSFHQLSSWQNIPVGNLIVEGKRVIPTNLPVRSHSFRGRAKDIHQIIGQVLNNRLVTITGVGGIGKTTVSVEVARWFCLREHFPDGVFMIDLRESTNSNRLLDLMGTCFSKQFSNMDELVKFISNLKLLFLLDNMEDLLFSDESGVHDKINKILKFAPATKILVTSQRQIGGNLHEPERIHRMVEMNYLDSVRLFCANSKREVTKEELHT